MAGGLVIQNATNYKDSNFTRSSHQIPNQSKFRQMNTASTHALRNAADVYIDQIESDLININPNMNKKPVVYVQSKTPQKPAPRRLIKGMNMHSRMGIPSYSYNKNQLPNI